VVVVVRARPNIGFGDGFGTETVKFLGFGLVSVTAVTLNLVSALLRLPETQILSSANTESYYSLPQSLPDRMLSWFLEPVVLRYPTRRAKVVTPLADSRWEMMLDSRHSLSYLIFLPLGRGIG